MLRQVSSLRSSLAGYIQSLLLKQFHIIVGSYTTLGHFFSPQHYRFPSCALFKQLPGVLHRSMNEGCDSDVIAIRGDSSADTLV